MIHTYGDTVIVCEPIQTTTNYIKVREHPTPPTRQSSPPKTPSKNLTATSTVSTSTPPSEPSEFAEYRHVSTISFNHKKLTVVFFSFLNFLTFTNGFCFYLKIKMKNNKNKTKIKNIKEISWSCSRISGSIS